MTGGAGNRTCTPWIGNLGCKALHYRCPSLKVQLNFSDSNTFGTMKISSRQGLFEGVKVDYSARSGGLNRDIFFIFFNIKVCCVYSLELPQ